MPANDHARLAEIATTARTRYDYERGVLDLLETRIGFDVAMFKRTTGLGVYNPGLDPAIARACESHWPRFADEFLPVTEVARRNRHVAVDVEVLGMRRMERLSFYQRLMRPHHGTSTAFVCLLQRGEPIAGIALGRTQGSFTARELEVLRALAPTLSLCEASVVAPRLAGIATPTVSRLTPREREVLAHLHLGHTNAQIALALGSSARTVRNQLSSIYGKLGVASRAEAAGVAVGLGVDRGF